MAIRVAWRTNPLQNANSCQCVCWPQVLLATRQGHANCNLCDKFLCTTSENLLANVCRDPLERNLQFMMSQPLKAPRVGR